MIDFKRISSSPLDPYERGTVAKYKTFSKLTSDFDKLRSVAGDKIFDIKAIRINNNDNVFSVDVWCLIPSEPFPRILDYDVVVRFYFDDRDKPKISNATPIQVFTNSPSFMFTYAYVFNKEGAIIPDLVRNLSQRSITEAPNRTNPKRLVGFEKSLFFAFLLLKHRGAFKNFQSFLTANSTKVGEFKTIRPIDADMKLKQYEMTKKSNKNLYSEYQKRNSFGFF